MNRRFFVGIAAGVVAIAIAVGVLSARSSFASQANNVAVQATADPATTITTQASTASTAVPGSLNLNQQSVQNRRRAMAARLLIKATADVTGLAPKDVVQELRAGKSLAQIAQEKGKTGDDILAQLRTDLTQRLNQWLDQAKNLINQPGLGRNQQAPAATATP